MNKLIATSLILATVGLWGCAIKEASQKQPLGLKDAYQQAFMIGGALNRKQALGQEPLALAVSRTHFNTITAENEMKWESLQPTEGQFEFDAADKMVDFAVANNMFVVGHTMLWHHQTPDWVFQGETGLSASKASLQQRLTTHMTQIATHFGTRVDGWDVVNEAFNDDGTWRNSKWYQILGDDYVAQTFILADKLAPHAELYYNDYNLFKPTKRQAVIKLVRDMQQRGIRIDGIGIQGHYGFGYPDLTELEKSIKAFAALGVKVMFTELDISVLPFPEHESQGADVSIDLALQERLNPYAAGLPADVEAKFTAYYVELFELFLRHRNDISRVTFWGVNDAQTWRNDWPMKGRADYPLLFDRNNAPKPAVEALINLVQSN